MISTKLPVLLSSGMSSFDELAVTVQKLGNAQIPFLLMQCTSAYPCPPERVGLNVLGEMRTRFHCETGLSDHSGTIWPSIAAVLSGAKAVEVHVTWDHGMFGPDAVASVTFTELKQMVEGIRFCERMLQNPVNKEQEAAALRNMRQMFGQSLVAATDLQAGDILTVSAVTSRKPQAGIPASELGSVLGARARRHIRAGEFLKAEDLQK
jgi:N-acetylneuraminate synthase